MGTTDKKGIAAINRSIQGDPRITSGLPPGFYRVEITKPGEKIPAKYNTSTMLGREIAMDAGIEDEIRFDLSY